MKLKTFFLAPIVAVTLTACSGTGHITYHCTGDQKTKDDVLAEFGTPERVIDSVRGAETWEYTMGSGVKTYTFNGNVCVRSNSRS
jgi:hypothetical protein